MPEAMGQAEKEMVREIPPKDGSSYVDQFWSGLYGTLCAFAQAEARLVWVRYSAFLIVHGLLLSFVKDNLEDHVLLFWTSIVGLVICCVWGFLNHCGWANQNLYLWHASGLKFSIDNLTLPTDAFRGAKPPAPGDLGDSIYWTAQLLPIMMGVIDCFGIYQGADTITSVTAYRFGIALMGGVIGVGTVVVRCRNVQGKLTSA